MEEAESCACKMVPKSEMHKVQTRKSFHTTVANIYAANLQIIAIRDSQEGTNKKGDRDTVTFVIVRLAK